MRSLLFLLLVPLLLLSPTDALPTPDFLESTAVLMNNLFNSTKNLLSDVDAQACMIALKAEFANIEDVTKTMINCAMNASSPDCNDVQSVLADRGLRLIDTWPKFEAGFLSKGPFFFLGDYDECAALGSDTTVVTPAYDYCRAHLSIDVGDQSVPAVAGLCLPRDCGDYLRKHPQFSGLPDWLELSGWESRAHFAPGPTDGGWRCAPVGAEAARGGAVGAAWALVAMLATLVVCGSAVDRWRQREITNRGKEDYDRLSAGSSQRSNSSISISTAVSSSVNSDAASSEHHLGKPVPSIALTYRDGGEIRAKVARVGVLAEMLCSFSLRSSVSHLFRNAEKDIKCLHALRVLAAVWVVVGHSCLFSLFYIDNARVLKESMTTPTFASYFLLASPLAVDTFLFISGAVMAVTYRKRLLFRRGIPEVTTLRRITRWILLIVHRIFRVYPTILIVSLFTLFVFNALGDGPMWDAENGVFGTNCTRAADLAPHLFFYGNMAPSFCLPWLWHLSLDMQIQIFCPLLLIGLTYAPVRARIVALALTVLIVVYRVVSVHSFGIHGDVVGALLAESAFPQSEKLEDMFIWFYGNPLSRAAPFLIGSLAGWQVCVRSERDLDYRLAIGLKLTSALLLITAFITPASDSFYHTTHLVGAPIAWSAGLALLVWLCENGHCRSLQSILGSHRLLPFSRLSFGIYITHEQILLLMIFTQRRPATPTSLGHFLLLAVTAFTLSLLVSFLLAVTIEIPPQTLEKRLLKKRHRIGERRPWRAIEESDSLVPAVSSQDKTALWVSADHSSVPLLQSQQWPKCSQPAPSDSQTVQQLQPVQQQPMRHHYSSAFFPPVGGRSFARAVDPASDLDELIQSGQTIVEIRENEVKEIDDSSC